MLRSTLKLKYNRLLLRKFSDNKTTDSFAYQYYESYPTAFNVSVTLGLLCGSFSGFYTFHKLIKEQTDTESMFSMISFAPIAILGSFGVGFACFFYGFMFPITIPLTAYFAFLKYENEKDTFKQWRETIYDKKK